MYSEVGRAFACWDKRMYTEKWGKYHLGILEVSLPMKVLPLPEKSYIMQKKSSFAVV